MNKSVLDDLLEKNILCKKCLNIPLLGIEFLHESKNIFDIIKLHSFCLNHTNSNKVNEFLLNNIFKYKEKNKNENNIKINCECCKKNENEYLCLNCKRIICKECFKYHKSHKVYDNNKYLISKDDLDKIEDKFKSAKTILNMNLLYIRNQINSFKSQLQKLENLYKEYQDINDKLMEFSNFILEKYKKRIISGKSIYFPIYFNVKNVLEFNFQELYIEKEDLSIKSFTNYLIDRIKSGSFFLLSDSKYNKNLNDYTNDQIIKLNTLKFDEFKEIKVDYSKIILLEDKTRIVGVREGDNLLEVFNIQNKSVETSIKLDLKGRNYNFFLKDNILLLISKKNLYIINSKTFSILQTIESEIIDEATDYCFNFIYAEILSKDSIGIVGQGDLRNIIDFSSIKDYINLPFDKHNFISIANYKYGFFKEEFEKENYKYSYFLIYQKDNSDNFILKKIILLLRQYIDLNEVEYVSYKYFENDDTNTYCGFYFESLNRFSDTEFVISFSSTVEEKRDQYNYYITDQDYSDETIYYYLNIDYDIINYKICSTKETSFLHKIGNTFYFLFNKSEECSKELKNLLKAHEFIEIKMGKDDFIDFYYQNKTILGWDDSLIYYGEIYSNNEFQIVKKNYKYKNDYIISIYLNPNIIFYDDSTEKEKN